MRLHPSLGQVEGKYYQSFKRRKLNAGYISGDPRQYGFDFGLWTRQIVANLIKERLGYELSLGAVSNLLYRQGITP
jgi:Winged helix-turn helix